MELTMTTLELKLNLPDRLAQDAAQMGLLDPDSLQTMLREAVRSRRIAQLALARQRVAEAGIAPMSLEEIQAEVNYVNTFTVNPFTRLNAASPVKNT